MSNIVIDSMLENSPLTTGKYYEKFVKLSSGQYTITAKPLGSVNLQIFTENGQRIASDEGNLPGHCYIILPSDMNLKFKVIASSSKTQGVIHYKVEVENGIRGMG